MPRNMSFALTTKQAREKTKTVTRRLGWRFLKPGDIVQQVEKGIGLKKGEKIKPIHLIRILSTREEPIEALFCNVGYGLIECQMEGFPDKGPEWFVDMFCKHNKCDKSILVNRIEYEYV